MGWSGQVGIASGLVYRGFKLNDETIVPNVDLVVEHASGFYLHGWLTRVDLPQRGRYYTDSGTVWQTFLDGGYTWRASPAWTLSLAHGWFHYSDDLSDRNPDYREWMFSIDYNNLLVLDYTRTEELWGLDERQDTLSLSANWPFTRRLIGAATLGWVRQEGIYEDNYRFAHFNLGYLLSRDWSVQLQFHESFDIGATYENYRAKRKWVTQLNWHW